VFDAVGKELLAKSIAVTKPLGRMVSITGPTGDLSAGYYKDLTVHFASTRRTCSTLDELRALIEQGRIKPVIDTVLPLREIAQAHQRLEQGRLRRKIVLQIGEGENGSEA
jgi:NADPH:quinone reductase